MVSKMVDFLRMPVTVLGTCELKFVFIILLNSVTSFVFVPPSFTCMLIFVDSIQTLHILTICSTYTQQKY